ncbi:hypothetical protein [Spirosoma radiotolerans]|uniref:Uncharacterized protein n=1 Tax=Spirosoma radiotolerans TaxID=1379870 RepID=A0A0E3V5W7_9BACT|nr:hypothetical protein [Spirosoma radiotolerans]AKD54016.1 hypothetical protein SD10_02965 [Spirosoma radiotolerans]
MEKKDTRYFLDKKTFLKSERYEYFKEYIVESGSVQGSSDSYTYKVYNPFIAALLFNSELIPVKDEDNVITNLNGADYKGSYVRGYQYGVEVYVKHLSPNLPLNAQLGLSYCLKNLHNLYKHHSKERGLAWEFYKTASPSHVYHAMFWEFGYYAGLISEINELTHFHPSLHDGIFVCNSVEEGSEKIERLSLRQIAYFYQYTGETLNELNSKEIAEQFGYSGSTAGYKLYKDHYMTLTEPNQRTAGREAAKNIRAVLPYLQNRESALNSALDELMVAIGRQP